MVRFTQEDFDALLANQAENTEVDGKASMDDLLRASSNESEAITVSAVLTDDDAEILLDVAGVLGIDEDDVLALALKVGLAALFAQHGYDENGWYANP